MVSITFQTFFSCLYFIHDENKNIAYRTLDSLV